jgi:spermidine dehydrogenase
MRSVKDSDLGINKPISRRDFVGGVAVAISGSLAWRWAESGAPADSYQQAEELRGSYPPIRTGMRGSHEGSYEVAHKLRDGVHWDSPEETGEFYDLIVVGGGLSGLAAAWYFREAEPAARILILDNHDDFGGHAKRNEFWHGDRMLLSHGGTQNISDLNRYSEAGRRLIGALGIDVERYSEIHDDELYRSHGLRESVFFGRETFGTDRLAVGTGEPSWREFFARTPLSDTARKELVRLYDSDVDYLEGSSLKDKVKYLQQTSYEEFLLKNARIGPEAVSFVWRSSTWAIGLDAISAWVATDSGWPGTAGLKLGNHESTGAAPTKEALFCQFPDGNATIARLLVRSLVPDVAPGRTLDDVVAARFDYSALDAGDSPVRIRLDSTAINVRHRGDPTSADEIEVKYVRGDRAYRVKGGRCVLACYNAAIPHICDELPAAQKEALSQAVKAPLIYTNVLIRNWTAFARLGIRSARCPGSYFEYINLTEPVNIGAYRHSSKPDEAIVVRLFRAPLDPRTRGLPATEQWRAARAELLTTTFETFELKIRDQLGRILSAGGFDPARDIEAITVNRWPHGYAYGHDPETGQVAWMLDELPPERSPWLAARKPFGRIAIANSDAVADAMTEGAFNAAHLAVEALVKT